MPAGAIIGTHCAERRNRSYCTAMGACRVEGRLLRQRLQARVKQSQGCRKDSEKRA